MNTIGGFTYKQFRAAMNRARSAGLITVRERSKARRGPRTRYETVEQIQERISAISIELEKLRVNQRHPRGSRRERDRILMARRRAELRGDDLSSFPKKVNRHDGKSLRRKMHLHQERWYLRKRLAKLSQQQGPQISKSL